MRSMYRKQLFGNTNISQQSMPFWIHTAILTSCPLLLNPSLLLDTSPINSPQRGYHPISRPVRIRNICGLPKRECLRRLDEERISSQTFLCQSPDEITLHPHFLSSIPTFLLSSLSKASYTPPCQAARFMDLIKYKWQENNKPDGRRQRGGGEIVVDSRSAPDG